MKNQVSYAEASRLRQRIWALRNGVSTMRHPGTRERMEDELDELEHRMERERIPDRLDKNLPRNAATLTAASKGEETEATRKTRELLQWREENRAEAFGIFSRPAALLILCGPRGLGKTVALVREVANADEESRFERTETVASTDRDSASFESKDAWEIWVNVPLLAIDDAGVERSNPERIGSLLIERWDAGFATIVSTNLSAVDFSKRYFGSQLLRMQDRLRTQPFWIVELTGESQR